MSENTKKEWTLMFYFASDNPLAPGIVSQMKSLKNAGYHPDVNVVTYFDPQTPGTPTHFFDVNAIRKLENPTENIGFNPTDPYVRSLMEDRLWRNEMSRDGKTTIRESIITQLKEKKNLTYNLPEAPPPPSRSSETRAGMSTDGHPETKPDENFGPGPNESLQSFLDFCAEKYQAQHYMLFILGHGLVVGDDVFLFDEHAAKHSVTLKDLGDTLTKFKDKIRGRGEFELVSFHSCSMSSLEVAFELQDTANYMLASQGPAFVGSWPYREILIRVFNDVANARLKTPEDVKEMIGKIFDYVFHNSTDYLLAGYSFDVCLCDLSKNIITAIAAPLKELSDALVDGLKNTANPLVNYSILLAHWKSQSYFQENYTDLFDFCFCLDGYCGDFVNATNAAKDASPFQRIQAACQGVMGTLTQPSSGQSNSPVIRAIFAGPDSQYSHGLSVFFPWTRPTADRTIMSQYEQYKFSQAPEFNQSTWFRFLNQYWGPQNSEVPVAGSTMRDSHGNEDAPKGRTGETSEDVPSLPAVEASKDDELTEDIINLMFNAEGPLNSGGALSDPNKVNPPDPTGDECTCGSIKNYLRDTRKRAERGKNAHSKPTFPVNQTLY